LAEAEREKAFAREQELREEEERANRLKDELLAIMSRELRNPLCDSRLFRAILIERRDQAITATTAQRLEQIVWNLLNNSVKFTPY
jgi:signal transduction histidine kinase